VSLDVKSALIWNPAVQDFEFSAEHPFSPKRWVLTHTLIEAMGLASSEDVRIVEPHAASDTDLLRVHSAEYVAAVKRLSNEPTPEELREAPRWGLGSEDNPVFAGMHEATALLVGGTLRAAELVMSGEVTRAFNVAGGLHHAHRDRASGFCVYNDLAVAIAWIREKYRARVLYIDYDAHHGDGVQGIFYSDPEVLTFSLHESGRFLFPGTGFVDELGEGDGYGYSFNAPMEPFTEDDSWLGVYAELLPEIAAAFRPEVIVLQNGCDAHVLDPLTHLRCTTRLYEETVKITAKIADEYCGGRIIATGGGGYDIWRVVPRAWTLVWATLTGQAAPDQIPFGWQNQWQGESPLLLPERLRDRPDDFSEVPRRAEIEAANRRTLGELRRVALPALTGWSLGF
jgi:acetoin utilization protein AcuC